MLYIALLTGLITGLVFYYFNKADQRITAQESAPPGPGLGLREAAGTVWYEGLRLLVLLFARLGERHIRRRLCLHTAALVLAYMGGAWLFCFLSGDMAFLADCQQALPALLLIDLLMLWLVCLASASRKAAWLVLSISLLGTLLQLSNGEKADMLVLYHLAALIFSAAFLCFIHWLELLTAAVMIKVVLILTTLLYAYTAVFGITAANSSTKVWVRIAGILVQTSELTKLLALLSGALLLADHSLPDRQKLLRMAEVFLVNAVWLFYLREYSTLMVIAICFGAAALLSLRDTRLLIRAVVLTLSLAVLLYGLGSMGAPFLGSAYLKLSKRMSVFTEVEANGQLDKALQELRLARWVGSTGLKSMVPVGSSDFVVINIVMKLGMVALLLIVMAYIALLCFALRQKHPIWGLGIVVQSLMAVASSTGLFATVGLAPVLLGEGGSTYVVAWTILAALLADSTHIVLTAPASRRSQRRRLHHE